MVATVQNRGWNKMITTGRGKELPDGLVEEDAVELLWARWTARRIEGNKSIKSWNTTGFSSGIGVFEESCVGGEGCR